MEIGCRTNFRSALVSSSAGHLYKEAVRGAVCMSGRFGSSQNHLGRLLAFWILQDHVQEYCSEGF